MSGSSDFAIVLTDAPDPGDTAVVQEGLRAYNTSQAGYDDSRPLAVRPGLGESAGRALWRQLSRPTPRRSVFPPRKSAPRSAWQPALGDGRGRGAAAGLHPHRAEHVGDPGAGLLSEAGL